MRDCVRDAFLTYTQGFEGLTHFMYLDIKNLVSIGYGNLIDPHIPALLDFRDLHGAPVSANEVRAEWDNVKSLTRLAPMGGGVFRHYTRLRATSSSIEAYARAVMNGMWEKMVHHYPDAEEWPADAQLGVLSMAWACGENFPPRWPRFSVAAKSQNWTVCADECHIEDSHNPGVTPRNKAQRTLFLNAAQTCTPELLLYSV